MMKKNFTLQLCLVAALLGACVAPTEQADDPKGNFEALWQMVDERYCFFEDKGIDWQAVHREYEPQIFDGMTRDDLFDKLSAMLNVLKDGHVNLFSAHRVSGYDEWYTGHPWNFRADILQENYLGRADRDYRTAGGMLYKTFANNIGYVRYASFTYGISEENLNEVLSALSLCNGLIIDVRDNGGGNITYASRIAARFTNERVLTGYIRHKTGKAHNAFSDYRPLYLEPAKGIRWQKKVVVLTNRRCYSATNDFVNEMKSIESGKIIVLGDRTGGGSGMPFSGELPNGWGVRFSVSPHYDKNKQSLEQGIEPDIRQDMLEADMLKHRDTIIESALELLAR